MSCQLSWPVVMPYELGCSDGHWQPVPFLRLKWSPDVLKAYDKLREMSVIKFDKFTSWEFLCQGWFKFTWCRNQCSNAMIRRIDLHTFHLTSTIINCLLYFCVWLFLFILKKKTKSIPWHSVMFHVIHRSDMDLLLDEHNIYFCQGTFFYVFLFIEASFILLFF